MGSSVMKSVRHHGSRMRAEGHTAPQEPQDLVPSPAAPHFGQALGFILT